MWLTNTQAAATLHSIHERVCLRSLPKSRTFLSTTTFLYVIHDGPFFMNPSHQLDSSGRFRQSMNTKMSFGLFFNRTFAFGHRHLFWITVTITHRTFFRTLLCIFIDICFFVLLPSLRVVTVLVFWTFFTILLIHGLTAYVSVNQHSLFRTITSLRFLLHFIKLATELTS